MKKYILFGAGDFGQMALEDYGADNVACFADNNPNKQGQLVCGKPVIGFEELRRMAEDHRIVISVYNPRPIAAQLEESGIFDYQQYFPVRRKLAGRLAEELAGKTPRGVVLYGTDGYMEQVVLLLRELGLGHLLQAVAAPEGNRLIGRQVGGFQVRGLEETGPEADCYIVASAWNHSALRVQLRRHAAGKLVMDPFYQRRYYDTEDIVFARSQERDRTEEEWNQAVRQDGIKASVRAYVEAAKEQVPLFELVEIETINRCNGVCSFCPVNRSADPRPKAVMSRELFEGIIDQLAALDYSGKLALFSNNEPLLDQRIIELHKYARERLPKAVMHLYTNGILLTVPMFEELIQYLDELVIDNYQQELRLIRPSREIKAYVESHPQLRKKVTIVLRKPHEVLSSRGGDAPNRRQLVSYGEETCAMPFQQLIIRPDGKVSLCCNDPLGRCTLGDLTKQTILDVWYGPQYQMVRKCVAEGRKNWKHCEFCDVFSLY